MEAAAAYLHYFSMMLLAGLLLSELALCTRDLQPPQLQLLARVDMVYLSAALLVLASGLARLLLATKGASFYFMNPMFYIKVTLFFAIALVSIMPTLQFRRWNRALELGESRILRNQDIDSVRRYLTLEAALLACIPLAAVMLSRGIGTQH